MLPWAWISLDIPTAQKCFPAALTAPKAPTFPLCQSKLTPPGHARRKTSPSLGVRKLPAALPRPGVCLYIPTKKQRFPTAIRPRGQSHLKTELSSDALSPCMRSAFCPLSTLLLRKLWLYFLDNFCPCAARCLPLRSHVRGCFSSPQRTTFFALVRPPPIAVFCPLLASLHRKLWLHFPGNFCLHAARCLPLRSHLRDSFAIPQSATCFALKWPSPLGSYSSDLLGPSPLGGHSQSLVGSFPPWGASPPPQCEGGR